MNDAPTCTRCGWHRFANDPQCGGCARLDAQDGEQGKSIEQPGDRYVRIVNGERTYSAMPTKDTMHDPRAHKRELRRQNHS